jgi:hypothetical protein
MSTFAPASKYFQPNEHNIGGRVVINQQMFNHQKAMSTIKSTMRTQRISRTNCPDGSLRDGQFSATKQVPLNPYTTETLYQLKKQRERQEEFYVPLASGMTQDQWRNINQFQIVGQSLRKKQNYHVAIDHYFNLRSMYRKINRIKSKKNQPSETTMTQTPVVRQARSSSKHAQRARPKTAKQIPNYNSDAYYSVPEKQPMVARMKPKSAEKVSRPKIKPKSKLMAEQQLGQNANTNIIQIKPSANGTTKITEKQKIKPQKKSNEKKINLEDYLGREISSAKNKKGQNEGGLSKKTGKAPTDDILVADAIRREHKKVKSNISANNELNGKNDMGLKYSDFLPMSNEKNPAQQQTGNSKGMSKLQNNYLRDISEDEDDLRLATNEQSSNNRPADPNAFAKQLNQANQNETNSRLSKQNNDSRQALSDEEEPMAEGHENESANEEDLLAKIPFLESQSEDHLQEFKQTLVEMIFNYEIFNEDEFNNFFEAVCIKNDCHDPEMMEQILTEVKEYLFEKFQELAEDNGAEENGDEDRDDD